MKPSLAPTEAVCSAGVWTGPRFVCALMCVRQSETTQKSRGTAPAFLHLLCKSVLLVLQGCWKTIQTLEQDLRMCGLHVNLPKSPVALWDTHSTPFIRVLPKPVLACCIP